MRTEDRRVEANSGNEARPLARPVLPLAVAAFVALHVVAALAFPGRIWGADHLRYLTPWGWAVWALALLAALLPRTRRLLAAGTHRAAAFVERRPVAGSILLFAVAWIFLLVFRTRNLFLGDGLLLTSVVQNSEETGVGAAGFVSLAIHRTLLGAIRAFLPSAGGAAPFVLTSTLSGALVVLLARSIARALLPDGPSRALLFFSLVFSGGILLFFGYVEHYPPMQAAILLYLLLAVRHLRGRSSLLPPTVALALAILLHISSSILAPAWLLLALRGALSRRKKIAFVAAGALLAGAAGWGLLRYTSKFYGGLHAFLPLLDRGDHSYAILSAGHASFVANEILLLLGGALLLPLLLPLAEKRVAADENRAIERFLAATSALALLGLLTIDPYLGCRDWDLMAVPLFPALLWIGTAVLRRRAVSEGAAVLLAGTMFLHAYPWVAAQLDEGRAVEMTVAAAALDPHYENPTARAPKSLGVLLGEAGYADEALLFFEKAVRVREDAQNFFNVGTSLARRGDHAEAVRMLTRAVELEPGYAQAYLNLALSLVKLREIERAESALRELLSFAPDYAKAHRALGFVLADRGAYDEALLSFRQAVQLEPDDAESWLRIALLLSGEGRGEEAREAARRVLAIDPANDRASALLTELGSAP
ncbi:MAG: tetratricopeptide repeat protein [Candidatus Latescibacterota bacterium]|nr:MAG: tetratricopeptide repeat protein [Candidatus Latescibacterota bacterium]